MKKGDKGKSAAGRGSAPTTSGFVGFSALGDLSQFGVQPAAAAAAPHSPAISPAGSQSVEFYQGGDSDLSVCFARFSKPNVTTKLKAFQEFSSLLHSREKEVLREVVSPWCYLYLKLAVHNDRRVRTACHNIMAELISGAGRKPFEPHMPRISALWWLSCADSDKGTAQAASAALFRMFPSPPRLLEALNVLAASVVGGLQDLLEKGVEELSDLRVCSREEAVERQERMHACALEAVGRTVALLSSTSGGSTAARRNSGALWVAVVEVYAGPLVPRRCSDAVPAIRRAAYAALTAAMTHAPELVAAAPALGPPSSDTVPPGGRMPPPSVWAPRPDVASAVLAAALGDATGANVPSAWGCVLTLVRNLPGVWGVDPGCDEPRFIATLAAAARRNDGTARPAAPISTVLQQEASGKDTPAGASAVVPSAAAATTEEPDVLGSGPSAVLPTDLAAAELAPLLAPEPTDALPPLPASAYPPLPPTVDIQRAMMPRLCAALKHAGYGSPGTVYTALAPLLLYMPTRLLALPFPPPSAKANTGKPGAEGGNTVAGAALSALWSGLKAGGDEALLPVAQKRLAAAAGECASLLLLRLCAQAPPSASEEAEAGGTSASPASTPRDQVIAAAMGTLGALLVVAVRGRDALPAELSLSLPSGARIHGAALLGDVAPALAAASRFFFEEGSLQLAGTLTRLHRHGSPSAAPAPRTPLSQVQSQLWGAVSDSICAVVTRSPTPASSARIAALVGELHRVIIALPTAGGNSGGVGSGDLGRELYASTLGRCLAACVAVLGRRVTLPLAPEGTGGDDEVPLDAGSLDEETGEGAAAAASASALLTSIVQQARVPLSELLAGATASSGSSEEFAPSTVAALQSHISQLARGLIVRLSAGAAAPSDNEAPSDSAARSGNLAAPSDNAASVEASLRQFVGLIFVIAERRSADERVQAGALADRSPSTAAAAAAFHDPSPAFFALHVLTCCFGEPAVGRISTPSLTAPALLERLVTAPGVGPSAEAAALLRPAAVVFSEVTACLRGLLQQGGAASSTGGAAAYAERESPEATSSMGLDSPASAAESSEGAAGKALQRLASGFGAAAVQQVLLHAPGSPGSAAAEASLAALSGGGWLADGLCSAVFSLAADAWEGCSLTGAAPAGPGTAAATINERARWLVAVAALSDAAAPAEIHNGPVNEDASITAAAESAAAGSAEPAARLAALLWEVRAGDGGGVEREADAASAANGARGGDTAPALLERAGASLSGRLRRSPAARALLEYRQLGVIQSAVGRLAQAIRPPPAGANGLSIGEAASPLDLAEHIATLVLSLRRGGGDAAAAPYGTGSSASWQAVLAPSGLLAVLELRGSGPARAPLSPPQQASLLVLSCVLLQAGGGREGGAPASGSAGKHDMISALCSGDPDLRVLLIEAWLRHAATVALHSGPSAAAAVAGSCSGRPGTHPADPAFRFLSAVFSLASQEEEEGGAGPHSHSEPFPPTTAPDGPIAALAYLERVAGSEGSGAGGGEERGTATDPAPVSPLPPSQLCGATCFELGAWVVGALVSQPSLSLPSGHALSPPLQAAAALAIGPPSSPPTYPSHCRLAALAILARQLAPGLPHGSAAAVSAHLAWCIEEGPKGPARPHDADTAGRSRTGSEEPPAPLSGPPSGSPLLDQTAQRLRGALGDSLSAAAEAYGSLFASLLTPVALASGRGDGSGPSGPLHHATLRQLVCSLLEECAGALERACGDLSGCWRSGGPELSLSQQSGTVAVCTGLLHCAGSLIGAATALRRTGPSGASYAGLGEAGKGVPGPLQTRLRDAIVGVSASLLRLHATEAQAANGALAGRRAQQQPQLPALLDGATAAAACALQALLPLLVHRGCGGSMVTPALRRVVWAVGLRGLCCCLGGAAAASAATGTVGDAPFDEKSEVMMTPPSPLRCLSTAFHCVAQLQLLRLLPLLDACLLAAAPPHPPAEGPIALPVPPTACAAVALSAADSPLFPLPPPPHSLALLLAAAAMQRPQGAAQNGYLDLGADVVGGVLWAAALAAATAPGGSWAQLQLPAAATDPDASALRAFVLAACDATSLLPPLPPRASELVSLPHGAGALSPGGAAARGDLMIGALPAPEVQEALLRLCCAALPARELLQAVVTAASLPEADEASAATREAEGSPNDAAAPASASADAAAGGGAAALEVPLPPPSAPETETAAPPLGPTPLPPAAAESLPSSFLRLSLAQSAAIALAGDAAITAQGSNTQSDGGVPPLDFTAPSAAGPGGADGGAAADPGASGVSGGGVFSSLLSAGLSLWSSLTAMTPADPPPTASAAAPGSARPEVAAPVASAAAAALTASSAPFLLPQQPPAASASPLQQLLYAPLSGGSLLATPLPPLGAVSPLPDCWPAALSAATTSAANAVLASLPHTPTPLSAALPPPRAATAVLELPALCTELEHAVDAVCNPRTQPSASPGHPRLAGLDLGARVGDLDLREAGLGASLLRAFVAVLMSARGGAPALGGTGLAEAVLAYLDGTAPGSAPGVQDTVQRTLTAAAHLVLHVESLGGGDAAAAAFGPSGGGAGGRELVQARRGVHDLAACALFLTAEVAPTQLRSWFDTPAVRPIRRDVEAYVTAHIAPRLFAAQLRKLRHQKEAGSRSIAAAIGGGKGAAAVSQLSRPFSSALERLCVCEEEGGCASGGAESGTPGSTLLCGVRIWPPLPAPPQPEAKPEGAAESQQALGASPSAPTPSTPAPPAPSTSYASLGASDAKSFLVQPFPGSREVQATYSREDVTLCVRIHVPPSFPLRKVEVTCVERMGVTEERWRRWELQMMSMLSVNGGSLVGALEFWRRNLDKEFDGVEPCPICYSVLSVTDKSLPRTQCRTCRNKFHVACLHKWFTTSNESKCPLCRQPLSLS